jgi:monofunctional glycosyltransferase
LSLTPIDLQLAVVSGEDVSFLFHDGVDTDAMREALSEWLEAGEALRGASTITQQLAKNLFLSGDRSFLRKLKEARYARWLETDLGKRRILELYLNIVELGTQTFGVEAGAQRYFGVSVMALSADQAAQLAAAIPSPLKHNPATQTRAFGVRYRAIKERMARFGNVRRALAQLAP